MAEEIDVSKLSLEERCTHKNWKVRMAGYEEAAKSFLKWGIEPKNSQFLNYSNLIKAFIAESNVVAQEKGLEAALVYVENAAHANKIFAEVASAIIQKSLTTKAKSKEIAFEILMQGIELEKQETIIEELIKGFSNKSPKIVIACTQFLKEALKAFGPKIIPVKNILKQIPSLLDNRDCTVREETKNLIYIIYQWLGGVITPALQTLKPIQIQELEAEFAKILINGEKLTQPTRFTKSQRQMMATSSMTPEEDDDQITSHDKIIMNKIDTEIDPYELIEAADILSQITRKFYDKLAEKAWQERKEAMEQLKEILTPSKYETNGDYQEIIKALKNIIAKDSNIVVVTLAADNLTQLAKGLRKKFGHYSNGCLTTLLEKFKEKKPAVVNALRVAVDAVFLTTTLEGLSEDIVPFLNNKNPSVRQETVSFLGRACAKCNVVMLNKKMVKIFVPLLLQTINDSDPTVRESSAETIGIIMKIVGEKALLPLLADIDKAKMDKIKDCCAKCTVSPPPLPPPPSTKGSDDKKTFTDGGPSNKNATSNKTIEDKPPKKKVVKGAQTKKKNMVSAKSTDNLTAQKETLINTRHIKSIHEAVTKASHLLPLDADALKDLSGSDLQDRLNAMENFTKIVKKAILSSTNDISASPTSPNTSPPSTSKSGSSNNTSAQTYFTDLATVEAKAHRCKEDDMGYKPLKWNNIQSTPANLGGGTSTSLAGSSGPQPRTPEYVNTHREQFEPLLGPTLKIDMFHRDFKYQIKALDNLITLISNPYQNDLDKLRSVERLFNCSDLILKWLALKFSDTNTTMLLKCYEFCIKFFELGKSFNTQYPDNPCRLQLHDCEVGNFVTYLLARAGDPKELIRKQVKNVLHTLTDAGLGGTANGSIYPSSRVWPYVLEALRTSKIAKQRQDLLEEYCRAVKSYGIKAAFGGTSSISSSSASGSPQLSTSCKIAALFMGDRDPLTRSAALTLIATFYSQCKDVVLKYVHNAGQTSSLTTAEQTSLDDRIKKIASTIPPPPSSIITPGPKTNTLLPESTTRPKEKAHRPEEIPLDSNIDNATGNRRLGDETKKSVCFLGTPVQDRRTTLLGTPGTKVLGGVASGHKLTSSRYSLGGSRSVGGHLVTPSKQLHQSFTPKQQAPPSYFAIPQVIPPNNYNNQEQQYYYPSTYSLPEQFYLEQVEGEGQDESYEDDERREGKGYFTCAPVPVSYNQNRDKTPNDTFDPMCHLALRDTSQVKKIISKPIVFPDPAYRHKFQSQTLKKTTPVKGPISTENNNINKITSVPFPVNRPKETTITTTNALSRPVAQTSIVIPSISTHGNPTPDSSGDIYLTPETFPALTSSHVDEPEDATISALFEATRLGVDTFNLLIDMERKFKGDEGYLINHPNTIIQCLAHQIDLLNQIYLPKINLINSSANDSSSDGNIIQIQDELAPNHVLKYYTKIVSILSHIFVQQNQNNSSFKVIPSTKPALRLLLKECFATLMRALITVLTDPSMELYCFKGCATNSSTGEQNVHPNNIANSLLRRINVLLLKIVESVPIATSVCALIQLLRFSVGNRLVIYSLSPKDVESLGCEDKRIELVMKCIWKAIKLTNNIKISNTATDSEEQGSYDGKNTLYITSSECIDILNECHSFLVSYPSPFWKADEGKPSAMLNDIPIRTVKTLLHSITVSIGPSITNFIPIVTKNQVPSEIAIYINRIIKTENLRSSDYYDLTPTPDSIDVNEESVSFENEVNGLSNESKNQPANDVRTLMAELSTILKLIGVTKTSAKGLEDLYNFKLRHPDYDINSNLLSITTRQFRDFIKTKLEQMAAKRDGEEGFNQGIRIHTDPSSSSIGILNSDQISTLDYPLTTSDSDDTISTFSVAQKNLDKYQNYMKSYKKWREKNVDISAPNPDDATNGYESPEIEMQYYQDYIEAFRRERREIFKIDSK